MSARRVAIAGGGIAGIAAAIHLARAGARVTLIESRKKLGGRATSHTDPASGRLVDNCQHVTLGCCTNYLDLLDKLGVEPLIEWSSEQHWVEAGGRVSVIKPGMLPAPLHTAESFIAAKFLSVREKVAVAAAITRILHTRRDAHRGRTFAELLERWKQPIGARRKFWDPVVISACNLVPERVSAIAALQVFQEGFLASAAAQRIGLSRVPLVELYDQAEKIIAAAGGRLVLGASVTGVSATEVRTDAGEPVAADAVICALPFERALKVVDAAVRASDARFAGMAELTHSPIIGVHLEFDRPVLRWPHAVLVDRPTQWLFRKSADGSCVHAVISAADEWMELDEEAITARIVDDIRACFPASDGARLVSALAIKERRATFAATPRSDEVRPEVEAGDRGGVILAGDYTRTGWPATMESAAISGAMAAAAALGLNRREFVVAAMAPAWTARLAGLRVAAAV